MKILVPIKRVVDYNVKVRPLSDNSNVDLNNVKMAVNPFCEIGHKVYQQTHPLAYKWNS